MYHQQKLAFYFLCIISLSLLLPPLPIFYLLGYSGEALASAQSVCKIFVQKIQKINFFFSFFFFSLLNQKYSNPNSELNFNSSSLSQNHLHKYTHNLSLKIWAQFLEKINLVMLVLQSQALIFGIQSTTFKSIQAGQKLFLLIIMREESGK